MRRLLTPFILVWLGAALVFWPALVTTAAYFILGSDSPWFTLIFAICLIWAISNIHSVYRAARKAAPARRRVARRRTVRRRPATRRRKKVLW